MLPVKLGFLTINSQDSASNLDLKREIVLELGTKSLFA